MANRFDPSNTDLKTGKPKQKPQIIIGVNTPADKYVPPKPDKQVIIAGKPAKTAPKPAPKVAAKTSAGESIREAITATKRREKEAGLD